MILFGYCIYIVYICNMRNETIILRSDTDTKESLKNLAGQSKRTASDYLRLLIEYASKKKLKL